ncbi:MAG: isopentenyl-diphosphate Delta-isomerase [Chitinophagaceae bacterium]|nr:isopentenyl-diphosphate Delta-isomerase [Chitinophagaceae bacterium]
MVKEQVILVNESDDQVGTMEKMEAHQQPVLHRAFSVFIFNTKGEMLLQKRAAHKYHSAGLWTNACCSHPRPGESIQMAAVRRLEEEMGFSTKLEKTFDFIYKASFGNGLHEFEFDHVFTGNYNEQIMPDPDEVSDFCFMEMDAIQASLDSDPGKYTAWFAIAFPKIADWKKQSDDLSASHSVKKDSSFDSKEKMSS